VLLEDEAAFDTEADSCLLCGGTIDENRRSSPSATTCGEAPSTISFPGPAAAEMSKEHMSSASISQRTLHPVRRLHVPCERDQIVEESQ